MARTGFACCGEAPCSPRPRRCPWRIGIGANTAIFTVANGLLFRPPAGIADPSELVVIGTDARGRRAESTQLRGLSEIARRTTSLSARFRRGSVPARHGTGPVGSGDRRARPRSDGHAELLHGARLTSGSRARCSPTATRAPRVSTMTTGGERFSGDDQHRRPDAADQRPAGHRRRRGGARLPRHGDPGLRPVARDWGRRRRQRRRRRSASTGCAASLPRRLKSGPSATRSIVTAASRPTRRDD